MVSDTSEWIGAKLCDGRYDVLRKLGEGGMAHVYVARDAKLERDVVIKAPRSNLIHDASFAGRFTREVRSLAKLAHPHVVPLIDIGQHEGVPFAVMQYLTGGSLRDRQPRLADGQAGPMPAASLHDWLPAIAQALDFVHKNKFIHRDVKPENILFDEDGQVFLGDLGIIKALSEPTDSAPQSVLTGAGMVLGTPQYMAPELIMGETVDGRVDQYALAVTLFEALTGRVPFNGANAPAIFIQQTTKAPPALSELAPNISPSLAAAVTKALGKTPGERFATCADFVQAALGGSSAPVRAPAVPATLPEVPLDGSLGSVGTIARPSPTWRETPSNLHNPTKPTTAPARVQKPPTSRRPLLVGGALAALIMLAAGLAYWVFPRAEAASLKLHAASETSLVPGEKAIVSFDIERQHCEGEVKCWLEGLPEGVKADPVTLPSHKSKSAIALEVSPRAPASKTTATLRATSGSVAASAPVTLTMGVAEASLHFTALAPQTLEAGKSVTILLHVERRRCAGPIALAVDGLPPGVTLHPRFLVPPVIGADESSGDLELRASPEAPEARNKKLTVVGKAENAKGETPLLLTVIAAPTPPPVKVPETVIKKTPDPKLPDTTAKIPPPEPLPVKPPPSLRVGVIPDTVLAAGERKSIMVSIDRKNFTGPVALSVTGLPMGGVSALHAPQLPEDKTAFLLNLTADPQANDARIAVGVQAEGGDLKSVSNFNVTVVKAKPPVVVKDEVLWQKNDKLTDADLFDRVRVNSRAKSYPVPFKTGKQYTIDLVSNEFDPYLRIEDNKGNEVVVDDDSGPGLNARIIFLPPANGIYYLVATSYNGKALGAFSLSIR
jgi:serine/threonine protein kinase